MFSHMTNPPASTGGRGWNSRLQHACTLAGLGRYITRARKRSRKPLESGKLVGVSGCENEQGAWFLNNGMGLGSKCVCSACFPQLWQERV